MHGRYTLGEPLLTGARLARAGQAPLLLSGRGPHACLDGQPASATALAHADLLAARELRWQRSPRARR